MSMRLNSLGFVPIAAVVVTVLLVASCAIQLRKEEGEGPISSSISEETDSFAADLEHCRTISAEQTAELENCRGIWAENRRRFLTSTKPRWNTPADGKPAGSVPAAKYQDRVPDLSREQSETR